VVVDSNRPRTSASFAAPPSTAIVDCRDSRVARDSDGPEGVRAASSCPVIEIASAIVIDPNGVGQAIGQMECHGRVTMGQDISSAVVQGGVVPS